MDLSDSYGYSRPLTSHSPAPKHHDSDSDSDSDSGESPRNRDPHDAESPKHEEIRRCIHANRWFSDTEKEKR